MKTFFSFFTVIALAAAFLASPVVSPAFATAPAPSVDYEFENDLTDSGNASTMTVASACPADPCNSTTGFGTSGTDTYWQWTTSNLRGGGFTLDTQQSIGSTYTIMLKFSFASFNSWRKIIDFKNRQSDNGFYLYNGKIDEYPLGTGTTVFNANTDVTLMVTRDGNTKAFTVYSYNGSTFTQEYQVVDSNDDAIPQASTLHSGGTKLGFFFDDTATSQEATTSGKVYYIRMWAGQALTPADLQSQALTAVLVAPSSSPTPTSATTSNSQATAAQLAATGTTLPAFLAVAFAVMLLGGGVLISARKNARPPK